MTCPSSDLLNCPICGDTSGRKCICCIKHMSLGRVAELLREREIADATADAYLDLWNATPCRFTYAERIGSSISQQPRCGDCGVPRYHHEKQDHRFV